MAAIDDLVQLSRRFVFGDIVSQKPSILHIQEKHLSNWGAERVCASKKASCTTLE
jgi:hypothetical protein